jgi:hypothetical protein
LAQRSRRGSVIPIPQGWTEHPIYQGDQQVAFFCTKDAEIHCYRLEEFAGRWYPHKEIERITRPIFAEFGCLLTKVRKSNEQGHEFVKRLGFYPVSDDGQHIYYRAERLKHARL